MKYNRKRYGLIIIAVFILGLVTPDVSSANIVDVSTERTFAGSSNSGTVTGVPYVWQEINGFCHWAAFSMILQSAGVPLDLYSLFAATGIGFSAAYIRYETDMVLYPGAFFPQMASTFAIEDIYGLNITMYIDSSTEENAALFADNLATFGIEYSEAIGFEEAFANLKTTIDSGYPFEVWTDPYYLPPWDYDINRELDIQYEDTSSGHAIVAVGYNETAGIVHIMDPGVGAFGDVGYPDDGRYYYDLNLTQLDNAWKPLFYGSFTVKPGDGIPEDFNSQLVNHILQRMRGDRAQYLATMEDAYFWVLGSDAFRGLAYDLTAPGLSSYLEEFGSLNSFQKAQVLQGLGLVIEGFLAIQHLSFRTALEALPEMLPEFELDEFLNAGHEAIQHFESLSDNSTLTNFSYEGGATITTDTFNSIAYDCRYTYNGDIESAVTDNEQDLDSVKEHLFAIADAWDAAANALEQSLNDDVTSMVLSIVGISAFVSVVSVLGYRRRNV